MSEAPNEDDDWPCEKCGRFEDEGCNGHGGCPMDLTRRSFLDDQWPALRAACKTVKDWQPYPLARTAS